MKYVKICSMVLLFLSFFTSLAMEEDKRPLDIDQTLNELLKLKKGLPARTTSNYTQKLNTLIGFCQEKLNDCLRHDNHENLIAILPMLQNYYLRSSLKQICFYNHNTIQEKESKLNKLRNLKSVLESWGKRNYSSKKISETIDKKIKRIENRHVVTTTPQRQANAPRVTAPLIAPPQIHNYFTTQNNFYIFPQESTQPTPSQTDYHTDDRMNLDFLLNPESAPFIEIEHDAQPIPLQTDHHSNGRMDLDFLLNSESTPFIEIEHDAQPTPLQTSYHRDGRMDLDFLLN